MELYAFQGLSEAKCLIGEALKKCFGGTVKHDFEQTHQDRWLGKPQM